MIIQVSPESPDLVRAIASLVLGANIVAGSVGLLSGGTAIIAPEGGALHRWSGTTFVLSMLLMSGIGVAAAPLMPQRSSVVPGLLTFFLVGTGWLAVKRPGPPVGLLSLMALVRALVAVTLGVTFRLMAADSSSGLLGGHGASNFYILAAMAVIAAVLDIKVRWGTSLAGAQRMRRHLRRNGGRFSPRRRLLSSGSAKVLPIALRGSPILGLP